MKNIAKKILLTVTVLSLVLAMASCNLGGLIGGSQEEPTGTNTPNSGTNPQEGTTAPEEIPNPENKPDVKKAFCEELTGLTKESVYQAVELDIATTQEGVTLNSQFVLNEREVTYSIEKLASFRVNEDGSITVPESYKETLVGSAVLGDKTDTVIFDGEILVVSNYNVLSGAFQFVAANIGEYNLTAGESTTIMFKVLDPSAFFGTEVAGAQNMIVTVSYTKSAISAITVKYSTASAQVVMNYTFH